MGKNLDRTVKVINRTSGGLAYSIPSLRVKRYWPKSGDYLNISINELLELKTVSGGQAVLEGSIIIDDKEALAIVFSDKEVEPEYHYGEDEINKLLYEAPVEQLLDTLDYAPQGVLDLIRSKAIVKLPNTTDKIDAIDNKFNISIHKIHTLQMEKDSAGQEEEAPKRKRRTKPLIEEKTPEIPKYNVVSKED